MPTLMVSVSGIRGIVGDGLDPEVIVKYVSAYADLLGGGKVVVGRDARITGDLVSRIVTGTLLAKGFDVIDIGITPTPTVLYSVKKLGAQGGIAITASHNPNEWNALKLLNGNGEFLSAEENRAMSGLLQTATKKYRDWSRIGKRSDCPSGLKTHAEDVLKMKVLDVEAIRRRRFRVLIDAVNGAGAYIMPDFLKELGCEVIEANCEKTGIFPHLPEPIPENLVTTMQRVQENKVDIGLVVDPDVDRLVLITEEGQPFIEENTVAQAVKFILGKSKGNVCVNLSTTRAVDDIVASFGCNLYKSPVGEANVVKKMKEVSAVIGGEGSGGVIYPALQYGRDALVGTALTLQHLLEFGGSLSSLKRSLPKYSISKGKISLGNNNPDYVINVLKEKYSKEKINTDDGLRIDFEDHWVGFRKSNTEPIIRCIAEAGNPEKAKALQKKYFDEVASLLK